MTWYWIIQNYRAAENPLVTTADDLADGVAEAVTEGSHFARWNPAATLRAVKPEDDGQPDDALQNHLGLLVFSARLRAALESAEVRGIQFLPIRVARPDGEPIEGFSVANIIERRPAMDRTRSDFDVFPPNYFIEERRGRVRGVRRAVLREEALAGVDVFRLEEFLPGVYVSERFRQVVEDGGFTGLGFVEAQVAR